MNRVFVYGTLKRSGALHGPLRDCAMLGCARLHSHKMLSLGAFPGVVPSEEGDDPHPDQSYVYGEVFEVTDEVLDTLDQIECTPTLYRRNAVRVEPDEAAGEEAYRDEGPDEGFVETYIYNYPQLGLLDESITGAVRIVSGRWPVSDEEDLLS